MAEPWLAVAEQVVSEKFGAPVRMDTGQLLTEEGRKTSVTRHSLSQGPLGTPKSAIVKRASLQGLEGIKRDWAYLGFLNDLAGINFLDAVLGTASPAPHFYGADRSASLFVLEDLGELDNLVPRLLGDDPQGATDALLRLAITLGKIHASTIGQDSAYEAIRASLGPPQPSFYKAMGGSDTLKNLLERIGIVTSRGFQKEIEAVLASTSEPGPFTAFTHGDPCPDNCADTGSEVKLFDFELGGFRHALLDATYARIMFPTCWCAGRLPKEVWTSWESAYRIELAASCAEATDDEMFYRGILDCCAYWTAFTLLEFLNSVLVEDQQWGIATRRQRILARLVAFTEIDEEPKYLIETRSLYKQLHEKLLGMWSWESDNLAQYPAFR